MQTKVSNKATSLRCYVRYNNQRTPFLTYVKVEPRYFDIEKQKAVVNTRFNGTAINDRLEDIRNFVKGIFEQHSFYPDPKWLKKQCEFYVVHNQVPRAEIKSNIDDHQVTGLVSFVRKIILDSENGIRLISKGTRLGQKYKPDTLKSYNNALKILTQFCTKEGKMEIAFDSVNQTFYNKLSDFFYNDLKLSIGYFSVIVKLVKLAMNEAATEGYHNSNNHRKAGFIKPNYESDTFYLTIDQIRQLQSHQFKTDESYLENARDLFMIGCWTGLRYSDYSTLSINDIEDNVIRIKAQKTSQRIAIPLHPMLREILDKYQGNLPRTISNQKLNKYIKLAAGKADLNNEVQVRRNEAGKDVSETLPFNELISSHTARRSFASNMFKKGIPPLLIMAITGHKTEASFLKYIRVSNEEKAMMLAELWKKIEW